MTGRGTDEHGRGRVTPPAIRSTPTLPPPIFGGGTLSHTFFTQSPAPSEGNTE